MRKQIKRFQGYTVVDVKTGNFFDYDFLETRHRPEIYENKKGAITFKSDIIVETFCHGSLQAEKKSKRFKKDLKVVKIYYFVTC